MRFGECDIGFPPPRRALSATAWSELTAPGRPNQNGGAGITPAG